MFGPVKFRKIPLSTYPKMNTPSKGLNFTPGVVSVFGSVGFVSWAVE